MDAETMELYLATSIALVLLAIIFAALLRWSIRLSPSASGALMKKGNPALGASAVVSTLDAAYLLPWKKLPSEAQLKALPLTLFWLARISSWSSVAAIVAGVIASQNSGVA
jgi:hypothetical protein